MWRRLRITMDDELHHIGLAEELSNPRPPPPRRLLGQGMPDRHTACKSDLAIGTNRICAPPTSSKASAAPMQQSPALMTRMMTLLSIWMSAWWWLVCFFPVLMMAATSSRSSRTAASSRSPKLTSRSTPVPPGAAPSRGTGWSPGRAEPPPGRPANRIFIKSDFQQIPTWRRLVASANTSGRCGKSGARNRRVKSGRL